MRSRAAWRICPLFLLLISAGAPAAAGQDQHKRKVPGLDKVTAGSSHQAFTGKVQSLDLQRYVLNVDTVQGSSTEIFPVKKGVRVATADGEKLKLAALAPGANVIVYYDQKGDQRSVKKIVVLAPGPPEEEKKGHPHS